MNTFLVILSLSYLVVSAENSCEYVLTQYERRCHYETIGELQDCYYGAVGQREMLNKYFYDEVSRNPKFLRARTLGRVLNQRDDLEVDIVVNTRDCEVGEIKPSAIANPGVVAIFYLTDTNIKRIPRGIFSNMPLITDLSLVRSKIEDISISAFENLPKLLLIRLHNNKLKHWRKNWFSNCIKLRSIDLSHNRITSIEYKAFDTFPRVEDINLNDNEIDNIHVHAFGNLPNLKFLGLRYNRLKTLDVFSDVPIVALDIAGNHLNFLSSETLRKLKSLSIISLHHNPWKCHCLANIEKWLLEHNQNVGFELNEKALEKLMIVVEYQEYSQCKHENIPLCISSCTSCKCEEYIDEEGTGKWLNATRNLDLVEYCVKLK